MDNYSVTTDALYGFKFRCLECIQTGRGKTVEAARIKHVAGCSRALAARRVDVTDAQRTAAAAGAVASVLGEDEIARAVSAGKLSMDDAMNRDF
jgi:hypothetical protein